MKHVPAVHRVIALITAALCAGGLGSLAAAPALAQTATPASSPADGAQRVLRLLSRGENAKPSIEALGAVAPASGSLARSADARQLESAREQLVAALVAVEQGGPIAPLAARYDAWRAAGEVIRIKFAGTGERLKASAEGAAYVARHEKAEAQVRAAFGRVQAVLDPLFAPGASVSPSQAKAAAAEARALLAQQPGRAADAPILRAQAVPFGGVSLAPRQPVATPAIVPTYETPAETAPTVADHAATPDAPLTDEIVAKARALDNDYVRLYEFVRNGTRNEWYAGSVKGAVGVLRSGAGNDVDQASLLTALLRAAGLNTRYVSGVVEVPVEQIAAQLGLPAADAASVPNALAKAGIAFQPVVKGGRVAAVSLARTWVSAYVPYTNYRGALVDASGKSWIPLDPFHKAVTFSPSTGFFGRSFTAPALSTEFQARTQSTGFAEFLRRKTGNALSSSGGTGTWQTQRNTSAIEPLTLDILPNSLPYAVAAVTREAADLPASELGTVRLRLYQGNRTGDPVVLDKTLPMSDVVNGRLTLSYGPASIEDHRVSLLYGGIDAVPLYLVGLRAQLKLGGEQVAAGSDRVEPGATLRLRIDLQGPWGTQDVEQAVVAGAYQALVIANDPQRPEAIAASDGEYTGARLLDGLGVFYARQWNEADRDIAGWLDAGVVRPVPAVTIASTTVRPSLVAGVPVTLEWTGVSLDAALRPVDAVGAKAGDFLALSALAGSSLESSVFKDQFSVEAISADRGLQLANERGVRVLDLTSANVATLDASDHTDAVKTAVRDLVRQGHAVRVPERQITLNAWTGSVWQGFKDGHAGYFLSGGLAGGETSVPPELWTLGFLADALRAAQTEDANNDPRSGVKIETLGAGDAQRGTVGEALPAPLMVRVLDKIGRPVNGAQVTFSVVTGDATLNGSGAVTVPTNVLGIAMVTARLGQSTGVNSVWMMRNPGDESPTRVGAVSVDVRADSASGLLQPSDPFNAYALPGPLSKLRPYETPATTGWPSDTADIVSLGTEDQYDNPIANVGVNVSISSTAACPAEGPGGGFKPGGVWNAAVNANACPSGTTLGVCGQPSVSLKSVSNGVVFFGVVLSNELAGTNRVTASANGLSRSFTYTNSGVCASSTSGVTYYGSIGIKGGESDGEGNTLSATKPGQTYPQPFVVELTRSEYPYFFNAQGEVRFQPYLNWAKTSGSITSVQVSNGGSAAISGSSFTVRTGGAPGRNESTVSADVVVTGIYNTSSGPREFTETLRPSGRGGVVFGVKPTITGVTSRDVPAGTDPEKIHLDGQGRTMYPIEVAYKVEPADYKNSKNGWIVNLLQDGGAIGYVSGDSQSNTGKGVLPRSEVFLPNQHLYQAQLVTRHTVTQLESDKYDLPMRQKLIAAVQARGAYRYVDVVNKRVCERRGVMAFQLTQAAVAKVTYQHLGASGELLGSPVDLTSEQTYPMGINEVELDAGRLGSGDFELVVEARAVADPSVSDRGPDRTSMRYQLSNALPVGQTLVKGVNVRNGILTYQTPRLTVPGRGSPVDFVAFYSSAAAGQMSPNGANWTHNHDLGLTVNTCGEVLVSAGDSGTSRFFPRADGTLAPDRGYHGTLVANRADNTWDFYSKDGTEYHYKYMNPRVQWRLVRVTDRNGNVSTYEYDMNAFPDPLLKKVSRTDGRNLAFTYERRTVLKPGQVSGPTHLLTRVDGPGGTSVAMDYDGTGNLLSHAVNGRSTTFDYSVGAPVIADRYRLVKATDAKGGATEYTYGINPLQVQGDNFTIWLDHLMVSELKSPLGGRMKLSIDTATWRESQLETQPGGTTRYTFNVHGNPLTVTDDAGTTTMTWADNDVVMTSKTNGLGVRTDYDYDAEGNLIRETVGGKSVRTTYEIQTTKPFSKSRVTSRTDRNGNRREFELDGRGNVTAERNPIGSVQHTYAANGDRQSTTDANGKTTRFEYDAYGNVEVTQNAVGARLETLRDERGRVRVKSDGNGRRMRFTYDGQDNVTEQVDAAGGVRKSEYDALGNRISETDERGHRTTSVYTKENFADSTTFSGPDGSFTRDFTYDGAGNRLTETDWLGRKTSHRYDTTHRVVERSEPLGKVTTFGYDAVGNLKREAVGDRVTTHEYDDLGRRTKTVDAENRARGYEFDGNGNNTATIDPLGRRVEMVYDTMDRLVEKKEPLRRTTGFGYDAVGNKTRETDPNGNVTRREYDGANREVVLTRADGTTVGSQYDLANNVVRRTDEGGGVTQFTYDELNRKLTEQDAEQAVTSFAYDPAGNVTEETWANGNVLRHTYNQFNKRTASTDGIGSVGRWEFDAQGNLLAEVTGNGDRTGHVHDALNHRTRSDLPGGRQLKFVPDVHGNVLESTDARGNTTVQRFDKLNRLTRTVHPDGGVEDIEFDAAGNKISQTDARGNRTTFGFDALNRVDWTQDPEGGRTSTTYDAIDHPLAETDKRGTVSEYRYDALNRRVSSRKAAIDLETLTYTPLGKVATRVDANGNRTHYTYDRRGFETGSTGPEGATLVKRVDVMGDVVQSIDAEGRVTATVRDKRRREIEVKNPANEVTRHEYDLNNNRVAVVRPSGGRSVFGFNELNWLMTVDEPMSRSTRYTRDDNGNLTRVTDGAGRSVGYDYDKRNRRSGIAHAGGAAETFVFDPAGNLTQGIDANGVSTTRSFDRLNRERTRNYSASVDGLSSITRTYDANGNPLTVTEQYTSTSRTTTKTFDAFDRELTVQDGLGGQMAYTYDLNGNRKTLATQDGKVTRYGYDGLNRLTGLSGAGGSAQYQYDKSGLPREQINGNGTTTSTAYDAAQRTLRVLTRGPAATLALVEYAYDRNGNRTEERINRPAAAQVTTFRYDAADRLTGSRRVAGADTIETSWTYDGADNRLTEVESRSGASAGTSNRSYVYDARNQLREIQDSQAGTATLSYDPQGNLVRKVLGADTTVYEWNARQLLAGVSRNGTVLGRYQSDHAGRRVEKSAADPLVPGGPLISRRTQWDDTHAVEDRDSAGTVVARYDFAGPKPVSVWTPTGVEALHADATGSIIATTANDGGLRSQTTFDAWGETLARDGTSTSKFGYTGHEADLETGLHYFKARYYDPQIGRFISEDTLDGKAERPASFNKYLYAYANPGAYTDPDGHEPVPIGVVYRVHAEIDGKPVVYDGSAANLKERFGNHRWAQLVQDPKTRVETRVVSAELDVEASRRGTYRAARNEALRAAEQVRIVESAGGEARVLNDRAAATPEHQRVWTERHKVTTSPDVRVAKPVGGAMVFSNGLFTVLDAYHYALDEKLSRYQMADYVLTDERGSYTLQVKDNGIFRPNNYYKNYITEESAAGPGVKGTEGGNPQPPAAGKGRPAAAAAKPETKEPKQVEIEKGEFLRLKKEAEAVWGTTDWKGDFVPGLLNPTLNSRCVGEMCA
jgi:RHS repeat-associated protein